MIYNFVSNFGKAIGNTLVMNVNLRRFNSQLSVTILYIYDCNKHDNIKRKLIFREPFHKPNLCCMCSIRLIIINNGLFLSSGKRFGLSVH